MVFSLNFVREDALYSRHLCSSYKLRIFTLMVTAREKSTWNAKQAEYNSIWCQEYMAKVLDTIVKEKLCESREEGLCVSFGFPFQCSTQIIVYAKNSVFALFKRRP